MDTKIDVEKLDNKYILQLTARVPCGDYSSFVQLLQFAQAAMVAGSPEPEAEKPGELDTLRAENARIRAELEKAYEDMAALVFEKQKLQSQIIGNPVVSRT